MTARASACLDRKWKYIAPLVNFGLGKHVVKADLMVGKPRELACGGTQNLVAGGIRSGVGCLGHGLST